ncbi:nitroreductase family protein [candidate division KSB1 bacterium]|nr:nitroreductase family protein [candidate division KSB1 bacterium]
MELMEAIQTRRSIRHYQSQPVERDKLLRVLEAGRLAPSARNEQEWRYIIVEEASMRHKLMEAASNQSFVAEAPVVIVACAETDGRMMQCGQLAYPIDVAISLDHITLKAVEEGLGTCWVGSFDADQVKNLLNIPAYIHVFELLTLGYPTKIPNLRTRLSLDEIVRFEKWR